MFDPNEFLVNGIPLIVMVFGLTQFLKEMFDWDGKKVTLLAASLGAIVMIAYQLIGIIPEPYEQVITIVFTSITFGMAASGYYKFAAKSRP